MSTQRSLHVRQAMLASLGVSLFLSVYVASQALSDRRLVSFLLMVGSCAAMVTLVVAVALTTRRR